MFSGETSSSSLRVALLLTDGVDHPRSPSAVMAAAEAKNHNVRVFTLGLTPGPAPSQPQAAGGGGGATGGGGGGANLQARLRSIASAPANQHVFSLDDAQLDDKLYKELVRSHDDDVTARIL